MKTNIENRNNSLINMSAIERVLIQGCVWHDISSRLYDWKGHLLRQIDAKIENGFTEN